MILLVSISSRAAECATALEQGTRQTTHVATSVPRALAHLRGSDYEVLVLDQAIFETDPSALDTLFNHAGTALPVQINLALHRSERIVREVQAAVSRAQRERLLATRAAAQALRSGMRDDVTGLLLVSELALRHPALPAAVAEKLRSLQEMAEKLKTRLQI